MIDYFKGIYGVNLLGRVHGSALYRGSLAGLLAVLIFLVIEVRWNRRDDDAVDHPYGVGVLITSVTFLIVFRANYGYQRYWEACGAVQLFMSKWMDATMHAAVFHLQNAHYDGARPPSFFEHDALNQLNLTRARRRRRDADDGAWRRLTSVYDCAKERPPDADEMSGCGARCLPFTPLPVSPLPDGVKPGRWGVILPTTDTASPAMLRRTARNADYFPAAQRPDQNFADRPDSETPPLFLQELAHLSSLLCAVALSTLRSDEGMESPLDIYFPGAPWPVADPDRLPHIIRREFQHRFHALTIVRNWVGNDRLPGCRNKYNAARPLLIMGGISDAEIRFLQLAQGPHAKVQLALSWLSEFLTRESLDGSFGDVHPALVSRLVQFLSDGMLGYHQARQIMYIPFPFPHAQLSSFFAMVAVVAVPLLMEQYTNAPRLGSLVSFLTVTCLVGLHEVARELEHPFRNAPNEIPVCLLQAMYNEALANMYSGYNPDAFWDPEMYQPALEALAETKAEGKKEAEGGATDTVLEMPALAEETGEDVTKEWPEKRTPLALRPNTGVNNDDSPECDYELLV